MKINYAIIAFSIFFVGCSESHKPLDSGTAVSGLIWKYSRLATVSENSGTPIPEDAKVDVYERLIIVRYSDGSRQVVALEYVTDLKIK